VEDQLAWAEIDLSAVAHNVRELRRITHANARLMVAVKANAYGHGAIEVARTALASGADALGVARLQEGIELRDAGLSAPILVFGYTPPSQTILLDKYDLKQTVYALSTAEAMSAVAVSHGVKIKVHLKVDTGMGRLGMLPDSRRYIDPGMPPGETALAHVLAISSLAGLELEGVMTHFATADSRDKTYANEQFACFQAFLADLAQAGLIVPIKHAANSGAIIDMPETHLDMVRAGISLYGLYPSDEVDKRRLTLKPVMTLKTRIIHLKRVPAGFHISYGCTYTTSAPTTIATVALGYADGFNRLLSSQGHMLVRGHKVPIVGRVCMDLTMLDVGVVPQVALEDEVVAWGHQATEEITVDEVANMLNTINYEVVATITKRVPRLFINASPSSLE
jgi:alanine racemase